MVFDGVGDGLLQGNGEANDGRHDERTRGGAQGEATQQPVSTMRGQEGVTTGR